MFQLLLTQRCSHKQPFPACSPSWCSPSYAGPAMLLTCQTTGCPKGSSMASCNKERGLKEARRNASDTLKASLRVFDINLDSWEESALGRDKWCAAVEKGAKLCEARTAVAVQKRQARKLRSNSLPDDVPLTVCPHCHPHIDIRVCQIPLLVKFPCMSDIRVLKRHCFYVLACSLRINQTHYSFEKLCKIQNVAI